MMFMSVVLPEPDGPMIATYSLGSMVRSTPFRAWTFSEPTSYTRWRSRIVISMTASLAAPCRGGFLLHLGAGLELAQRLVGPRDDDVAALQLAEHLDVALARDPGAHRHERRDQVLHDEHARDLLVLAPHRILFGRESETLRRF